MRTSPGSLPSETVWEITSMEAEFATAWTGESCVSTPYTDPEGSVV